jgi:glycosyltransferase involved in cell wall biosynthesis
MNVLFVVPYAPNLIRVRPYNLIRHLAARGHKVTLVTTWINDGEQRDLQCLCQQGPSVIAVPLTKPQIARNLLRAFVTGTPLQAEYCWQPQVKSQISNIKSPFDVVHVEHLRGAHYGLEVKSQVSNLKSQVPVVWDSVDCITYLFEQASKQSQSAFGKLVTRFELDRTRRYEGWLVQQFDQVLVTSETDKQELAELSNLRPPVHGFRPPISVLPNGVDLEYFTPGNDARQPDTLVFSGKMSYHANITAALYLANEVMPLVWTRRPGVRLVIAGSQPTTAVRQLAETYRPQVEITGFLPDLRVPLRTATVAVAPLLYGAGIQNKVLEALACGTPVAASPLAVSALKTQTGIDCLVADSPQAFADAILKLLSDDGLRERLSAAGRRYVETHHDWNDIAAQLESIYQRSVESVKRANV